MPVQPDPRDLTDLVGRWVDGWAAVRRFATPVRRGDGAVEVLVRDRNRRVEVVVTDPDPDTLRGLASEVGATADAWLTVFATEVVTAPPGLVVLSDDEVLMARRLVPLGGETRCVVRAEADRASATVLAGDVVASRGWVGVRTGRAVVDRVETHPEHRRQGLGAEVMAALETWAVSRGATHGLLAATAQGRALYSRLGWEVVGRMTTFAVPPAP